MQTKAQNLEVNTKLGEAVSTGNLQAINTIFAPNVVDHDPAPDQGPGPHGFIDFFTVMRKAFPDLKVSVDHLVQDEDSIAMAYTIHGTHKGDFLGIAPTNKAITARGVQIARFENGKIVERWGSSDELGIVKKTGWVDRYRERPLTRVINVPCTNAWLPILIARY
jgi:steroid delta-isomerase-like uncharacterized protein